MKILLIRPFKSDGGVGNYYDKIKTHFKNDVRFFYTGERKRNTIPFLRMIRDYLFFTIEVARNDYDLIHVNPSLRFNAVIRDGIFLLLSKLFRKKTLVFFRGWDDEFENIIRKRYSKLFGLVFFSADAIIVLASRFKTTLQEMGYTRPIFIETTLVPDEVFGSNKINQLNNGAPGRLNILFLSRIEKYKGVYEALEAFIILKKRYAYITMTLAGDGSELKAVKEFMENRNVADVKIAGWLDGEKKMEAYENADIFLFPSYAEGMPNSLLEAMAYGLPVITKPVGGIKDFFRNGEMGYFIEGTDHEKIVEVCEMLIKDSKRRSDIGKFNREYAKENFIASNVCRRLETIYDKIVFQNKSPKNAKSLYR